MKSGGPGHERRAYHDFGGHGDGQDLTSVGQRGEALFCKKSA